MQDQYPLSDPRDPRDPMGPAGASAGEERPRRGGQFRLSIAPYASPPRPTSDIKAPRIVPTSAIWYVAEPRSSFLVPRPNVEAETPMIPAINRAKKIPVIIPFILK